MWFEIDGRVLASWQEMQDLADGVYSLPELEDLYERRKSKENSCAAVSACRSPRTLYFQALRQLGVNAALP